VSLGKLSKTAIKLWKIDGDTFAGRPDVVATEEPLEIRLRWKSGAAGGGSRTVAVTMRTPGADAELAAGFLFAEGVIARREQIASLTQIEEAAVGIVGARGAVDGETPTGNVLEAELSDDVPEPELATLERHFFATSACGVCGKAGLETLRLRVPGELPPGPLVAPSLLSSLPAKLRAAQGLFDLTGGLHAAALFDRHGELLAVREDVGRHNALDKLVGWALMEGRLPLHDHVLLVSGRTSYEILQKSLVAGLPVVCAVSAPSSLAVDLAQRFGITLVGFLRGERCNVYSGVERIAGAPAEALRAARAAHRPEHAHAAGGLVQLPRSRRPAPPASPAVPPPEPLEPARPRSRRTSL
jgi:FdhD protein